MALTCSLTCNSVKPADSRYSFTSRTVSASSVTTGSDSWAKQT
ncbi:MAG: hypothetical protein NTZ56_18570 [Acidobacteria bacterium]|nr:hypothetical protein [Acidobacteriota bacterium]